MKRIRNSKLLSICWLSCLCGMALGCYSQKKTQSVLPEAADIWILAGQSNMAGAGRTPDTVSNPELYMLNMDGRWIQARNPLHRIFEAREPAYELGFYELNQKNIPSRDSFHLEFLRNGEQSRKNPYAVAGVGPGLYFGKKLVEATGKPVGVIPCALGGATIALWSPERKSMGDSSLYGTLLNRATPLRKRIKGVLWSQGESEAMFGLADTYEQKLLQFIDELRKDLDNPGLPVIIVQIGRMITDVPAQQTNWEKIREIQRQVIHKRKNLYLTTAIDLPLDDAVHTSTSGQKRLGLRMAELALSYVYKLPGYAKEITLESLSLHKQESSGLYYLDVAFAGVSGKLRSGSAPSDFQLRVDGKQNFMYVVCRTELLPQQPSAIRLFLSAKPPANTVLYAGVGSNPYMNVTDERDTPIPAFGPVPVPQEVKP